MKNEQFKHPPRFCPNCAKLLKDRVEYVSHSRWKETCDNKYFGVGYDCYCEHCKWSGDIEPDADDRYDHSETKVIE